MRPASGMASGQPAETFQQLIEFLEFHKEVRLYIGENVKDLLDPKSDNRAAVIESLASRGWTCAMSTISGGNVGARTARTRAWLVALHRERCGVKQNKAKAVLQETMAFLERLCVKPLPEEVFILRKDDPYLRPQSVASAGGPSSSGSGSLPQSVVSTGGASSTALQFGEMGQMAGSLGHLVGT